MNMMLPDFLIIGAPKCGTTWVTCNLNKHPGVFVYGMPENIETGFWNEIHLPHRDFPRYSKLFEGNDDKIKGEKTALYAETAIEHIVWMHRIIPGLKIIYMIRNPIEQQWSYLLHDLAYKNISYESIDRKYIYEFFYKTQRAWDYLRHYEIWKSVYGESPIHIGFYDDMKNRPLWLMDELLNHIGANPDEIADSVKADYGNVINKTANKTPMPETIRSMLNRKHAEQINELYDLFGEKIEGWIPNE